MSGDRSDGDVAEHEVDLSHEGETITLTVPADEPILDAAEAAGLSLPYSCRQGQCTSCVGRLHAGEVDQSDGTALDPMQKDDGYALLCVATPTGDCTVETDVQEELFGLDVGGI